MNVEPHTVLVSVTIPVLDGERYLADAIESIRRQTCQNWELLVVDDGSTDRSGEIAAEYAQRDPARIRVLHHPHRENRGMLASRRLGLVNSRGRYIARLDADDELRETAFAEQTAILDRDPTAVMVYGPAEIWQSWSGAGDDFLQQFSVPLDTPLAPPNVVRAFLAKGGDEPVGMLVRRDAMDAVHAFEPLDLQGELYEDIAVAAKICLRYPVVASSRSWYRYRQHSASYCSTVRQRGEYPAGTLRFLQWLGRYMDQHCIVDQHLREALQAAQLRWTAPGDVNRCQPQQGTTDP